MKKQSKKPAPKTIKRSRTEMKAIREKAKSERTKRHLKTGAKNIAAETVAAIKRAPKRIANSAKKAAKKVVGTKRSRERLSTNVAKGALLVTVGPVMAAEWAIGALWSKVTG